MHALIVDDSRATRLVLGQLLRKAGFEVGEAGGGRDGLEQLARSGHTALVLVDRHMPDMDGLEFIRAVRAEPRYAGLRLVLVTSADEPGEAAGALEAGAEDFLGKPFSREALLKKLEGLGLAPR